MEEGSFRQLTSLQELILPENRLTVLPDLPSSIIRLDARFNRIQSSGLRPEAFRVSLCPVAAAGEVLKGSPSFWTPAFRPQMSWFLGQSMPCVGLSGSGSRPAAQRKRTGVLRGVWLQLGLGLGLEQPHPCCPSRLHACVQCRQESRRLHSAKRLVVPLFAWSLAAVMPRAGWGRQRLKDLYLFLQELKKLQFLHLSDNELDYIPAPLPESLRSLHLQVRQKPSQARRLLPV